MIKINPEVAAGSDSKTLGQQAANMGRRIGTNRKNSGSNTEGGEALIGVYPHVIRDTRRNNLMAPYKIMN